MSESNNITFVFPESFFSDDSGFEFLAHLNLTTYKKTGKRIFLDFDKCQWFDANLCSPLGAIIEELRDNNNDVYVLHLPQGLSDLFIKNGFYTVLVFGSDLVSDDPLLSYQRFRLEDVGAFQSYIERYLTGNLDFPKMSERLAVSINKSILEIFNNAHIHGKCRFVHTCWQYYPVLGTLKFTISDLGVSIRKNVNDFFKTGNKIGGKESIEWAVTQGNTTRNGNIPGGLGLSLIRAFLTLNGGKLQICSSDGYWEEELKIVKSKDCNSRLIGTIVTFEFNLKDTKSYILKEELNPSNIF